jgi:diguanylate cyclase (GGDEF)-like protein
MPIISNIRGKVWDKLDGLKKYMVLHFLRLNIANKMLLGYLPLCLLMILVASLSLSSLERMRGLTKEILLTDIRIIDASDKMIDGILDQELFARRYSILKTPEMIEVFHDKSMDFEKELGRIEEEIAAISNIPTNSIREIHKEYNSKLYLTFDGSPEAASAADSIKKIQDELIAMLKKLSDAARVDQNEKTLLIAEIGDIAIKIAVVFVVLGILLGVGSAFFITRNISLSIAKLKLETEKISEGKFEDVRIIPNQDELGDLSRAFAAMGERLKALEEMYMDASPLTHLPGGVAVENVLKKRLKANTPLSFCLVDLDNFKALNDHHGYANGNEVIKTTANIIEDSVAKYGNPSDFIGHIGGDDFVFMTTPDLHSKICTIIIKDFDEKVKSFYTPEEQKTGYIIGKNRQGENAKFPIVAVSIVVVTDQGHALQNHIQVGEIAAELKEYVKSMPGSNFVVDRRRE